MTDTSTDYNGNTIKVDDIVLVAGKFGSLVLGQVLKTNEKSARVAIMTADYDKSTKGYLFDAKREPHISNRANANMVKVDADAMRGENVTLLKQLREQVANYLAK